jgi:hypothetical protein
MTDTLFIGVLISIFAAVSIALYHQSDVLKQNVTHVISRKELSIPASNVVEKKVNPRNATMIIPSGYQKIKSTYLRTTYIGTVDHPTINGGIITSSENISISHSEPAALPSESPLIKSPYSNDQAPFQDGWATLPMKR